MSRKIVARGGERRKVKAIANQYGRQWRIATQDRRKVECHHIDGVYYSEENSNYYCKTCKRGMGQAYFLLGKEVERLKAEQKYQQGFNDCLRMVLGSLEGYPNHGGDIQIMQQVERIVAAEVERLKADLAKYEESLDRVNPILESFPARLEEVNSKVTHLITERDTLQSKLSACEAELIAMNTLRYEATVKQIELEAKLSALETELTDEKKIVDSVWNALDMHTYADAKGLTISENVKALRSKISAMEGDIHHFDKYHNPKDPLKLDCYFGGDGSCSNCKYSDAEKAIIARYAALEGELHDFKHAAAISNDALKFQTEKVIALEKVAGEIVPACESLLESYHDGMATQRQQWNKCTDHILCVTVNEALAHYRELVGTTPSTTP